MVPLTRRGTRRKGRSRRKFIHERLELPELPVSENSFSINHLLRILRRVVQVMPQMARIPDDASFEALRRRRYGKVAVDGSVGGGEDDDSDGDGDGDGDDGDGDNNDSS